MQKKERLKKIISIIQENEISTQEELTAKLNELGVNVSQATVSRDINELNIEKGAGKTKRSIFVVRPEIKEKLSEKMLDLYKRVTLSIDTALNLVVIKTFSGNGSSVGIAIDSMHLPQVIGTIAGDDTLLIVTKSAKDAESLLKILRSL